ncbi:SLBB domain-containing protein [Catenovulum sp. SM1970]|uniref:SLBB domain-containing protein n=1 Tax=Marinifaba aquimaris TaxID=2741323 RepID=UPI001574A877|nr:SLBB domain-containing protein [Marinifaba aquimaris]NTS76936.1 SLBB domain-containing protein [Marinifaba aquimaris]
MIKSSWLISLCLLLFSSLVFAVTPSKEQIEQFKRLPKSQQEALAKQMGIDISELEMMMGTQGETSETDNELTPKFPRGTEFDEFGNPITDEELLAEEEEKVKEELKPFGHDVFANAPATFSPNLAITIPENYIIAPGDTLSIQFYGKKNALHEEMVSREGLIVLPELGAINVVGLTFSEAKSLISEQVKSKLIGVKAVVGLSELRSIRVFVLGDAHKPGPYTINSLSSMTHALFAAGGLSDIGSMRKVRLKRQGKLVTTLDLYDLLINGDSSNDMMLQSGDVVFVEPVGSSVIVDGAVRRPAIYEVNDGETFSELLKMAGGALPSAYLKAASVQRVNDQQLRTAINVDLSDKSSSNQVVRNGDMVYLHKNSEMFSESITLLGAVTRPGKYQWQAGKKLTEILPSIRSHLLHYADLNYGIIVREVDLTGRIEVHQFSIAKALQQPSGSDNIELKQNDRVIIFSRVNKLAQENTSFDELAFTQEYLLEQERKLAKEKYIDNLFWEKYGDGSEIQDEDIDEELQEFVTQSVASITGGEVEEEIDPRELGLFSRIRLLAPIVEKLKRQGAAGMPIQLVEVDGHVKFPGVYPLAVNATVSDLVAASGGVVESAYLKRAEVTRNVMRNGMATVDSLSIDLGEALAGNDDDILLKSRDRLNVHQIPAWSENHIVELRGEFVFPGKYTIRRGEKLSDLVAKAGGFTEHAYPQGSVFSREQLKEMEQQNLVKLASDLRVEMVLKTITDSGSNASHAELQKLLADLTKVEPVGRLVINLPSIVAKQEDDILLENGDVLYVPTMKNSINVIGQIQVTSSHIFDPNLTADDYISQSGGVKKRADVERIYVISANGSIKMLDQGNWFVSNSSASLKPGDTVVVPLDTEYMNNLELWSTATGILYNTAVAIAAISGI